MEKTFSILTLGCKVNQYESEAMAELFENKGYKALDFETDISDIYIINTCTVTNLSDRKSRQHIRRAKRNNPDAIVVVAGCYSQTSPEEVESMDGVDIVIGTTEKNRIVEFCEEYINSGKKINAVRSLKGDKEFQNIHTSKESYMTRAYMKVQDGCNRFCSYCIIPYARGPIRSRKIRDAVEEAKTLAKEGYKEIILTGIHVGSYGFDLGEERLIDLIEAIAKVDGIERIRLSSIEPMTITEDFLERALKTEKFCEHFHLSLQSGSDKVLKNMNRKYTSFEFLEKVNLIKSYMKNVGLTTDVIVGFPGESEQDFGNSIKLIEEVGFSKVHVFKYSKRDGTVAAKMENQIDGNIKNERSKILMDLSDFLYERFIESNKNEVLSVLFEEKMQDNYYLGYSKNYIRCRTKSKDDLKNVVKNVRIIGVDSEVVDVEIIGG